MVGAHVVEASILVASDGAVDAKGARAVEAHVVEARVVVASDGAVDAEGTRIVVDECKWVAAGGHAW